LALAPVRPIKDLDCPTTPPRRQQLQRHHADGNLVILARFHRVDSLRAGIRSRASLS